MIHDYQGNFSYDRLTIENWKSNAMGVYYCGSLRANGSLFPLYIGRATGEGGIRARLLEHLTDENWADVTHFGYCVCDTIKETEDYEVQEIPKFNPKYNRIGTSPLLSRIFEELQ